ncbi:VC0807 family protein [Bacillus sp. FSL W7-1360]
MNRKFLLGDILFFVVLPLAIWNYGRDMIGDYYAMLLSTIPGLVYSAIRLALTKRINSYGIYVVITLAVSFIINILSPSAEAILWNSKVWFNSTTALIILGTIAIRKPLFLYFAIDFAEAAGYSREQSNIAFRQKGIFYIFVLVTLAFVVQDLLYAAVTAFYLFHKGVEGYNELVLFRTILGWALSGIIFISIYAVSYKLNKQREAYERSLEEEKDVVH